MAAWLTARLLVALGWVLVTIPDRSGRAPLLGTRLGEGLLTWDGQWYLRIAEEGYRPGGDELRFWPLYPVLGRVVGEVVGDTGLGLVLVANVAALAAMVLLARLVAEATGDRATASRAAWMLALWPAAFVLVFAYAEALLLAASVGAALALRRRAWWWAAALGLVAGLTRPNGVAVVVLTAGYALPGLRTARGGARGGRIAAVLAPVGGFVLVTAGAAWWHGDALAPVRTQSPLRGDLVDPVSRLVRGVADLLGEGRLGDGLHLPFAVLALALVVLVARRVGRVEAAYSAVVVLVALSAENWNSLERYVLNAFPVFWALATVTAGRDRGRVVVSLAAATFVALTVLAWTGDYVP